ncbi:hypothetical protein LLE49_19460 [Alicyclobacillus tolerans]|nr:glycosyltransferase [Alicyclobacillus tolerans]MCF8566900.1 hypothetical protein [Alicyclobacillus tolerans]
MVIGAIVRNRAWILPEYLDALDRMEVPENPTFLFIENDSVDDTGFLLSQWCRESKRRHHSGLIHTYRGVEQWDHHQYVYSNLAFLRNRLLEWFLTTDADFFMSVDSDIIVQPDTFERLYQTHLKTGGIVGAAICNVAGQHLDGHTAGNFLVYENGALRHPVSYPMSGDLEVGLTGAVYLMPRWVIAQGARYGDHLQGEDVPFCVSAQELGCAIHMNMDARCEHRMVRS